MKGKKNTGVCVGWLWWGLFDFQRGFYHLDRVILFFVVSRQVDLTVTMKPQQKKKKNFYCRRGTLENNKTSFSFQIRKSMTTISRSVKLCNNNKTGNIRVPCERVVTVNYKLFKVEAVHVAVYQHSQMTFTC